MRRWGCEASANRSSLSMAISRTDFFWRLPVLSRKPMHNVTLKSGMVAHGSEMPRHGHARPRQEMCFRRRGRSRHVMLSIGACKACEGKGADTNGKKEGRTLKRCRTTTGSDTTMKALGPNASLYTPPLSRNLPPRHESRGLEPSLTHMSSAHQLQSLHEVGNMEPYDIWGHAHLYPTL